MIDNAIGFKEMAVEAFRRYNDLSGEDSAKHHSYLTASAINLVFAVELALKSLCAVNDIDYPRGFDGHNLSTLFSLLKPEVKLRLTNSYKYQKGKLKGDVGAFIVSGSKDDKARISQYSNRIDMMLEAHKQAFIDWRYNFETESKLAFFDYFHLVIFFDLIRNAVESEIIKLVEKAKIDNLKREI